MKFDLAIVLIFVDLPGEAAPYAVTGVDGIDQRPFYWEINEDAARYKNLNIDGTLKVPPHLHGEFLDFEVLYENLRYQSLGDPRPRRRSLGGATDVSGQPTYDTLTRLVVEGANQTVACSKRNDTKAQEGNHSLKRSQSVDLGKIGLFVERTRVFSTECAKCT